MVSVSFSYKHLTWSICDYNVDGTFFRDEALPKVIDDLVNGKQGINLETGLFIHDMCSPYANPETQS